MKILILFIGALFFYNLTIGQPVQTCPTDHPGPVVVDPNVVKETFTPPPSSPPTNVPPSAFPGDKIIYWVHGLGGEPEYWSIVGGVTEVLGSSGVSDYPSRKVTSIYPDYNELVGLEVAATSLHNEIVTKGYPHIINNQIPDSLRWKNFIVGNSQGGLVPRVIERQYVTYNNANPQDTIIYEFGGIVSFGTPHNGAQILNNVDPDGPNMAVEFAIEGCQALTAGPVAEAVETSFILDIITSSAILQPFVDSACQEVLGTVLPIVFKGQTTGITHDYHAGSGYIDTLSDFAGAFQKIAFWGVEQDPLIWRTMSSFKPDHPLNFAPFEADYDATLVMVADSAIVSYTSKIAEWEAYSAPGVGNVLGGGLFGGINGLIGSLIDVITSPTNGEADLIAQAYRKGLFWLLNADNNYKTIIGARTYVPITINECWCTEYDPNTNEAYGPFYSGEYASAEDCENSASIYGTCSLQQTIAFEVTEKESDGVVLAESAGYEFPGVVKRDKMPGSNHVQMVNDSNTKWALFNVFEGVYHDYFKTDQRQP